jgi:hypothetical protein
VAVVSGELPAPLRLRFCQPGESEAACARLLLQDRWEGANSTSCSPPTIRLLAYTIGLPFYHR